MENPYTDMRRYMEAETARVVSRHTAVFHEPPRMVPSRKVVDGPIIGNGDLGAAIGGPPELQRFMLSKCDFWKLKPVGPNAHPSPIGAIDVSADGLSGARYHAEQVLYDGEVRASFTSVHNEEQRISGAPSLVPKHGTLVTMRSWVCAAKNILVIELGAVGDSIGVAVRLWPKTGNEAVTASGNLEDGAWATRRYETVAASIALERRDLEAPSEAAVAMRLFGHRAIPFPPGGRGDGWSADHFTLGEQEVVIVASVVTDRECADPLKAAKETVGALRLEDIRRLKQEHRAWWHGFWTRSFVEIDDPSIEKHYYGSHYILASCSRNPSYPPGLFGNWTTTDEPAWAADYHLNYNHQAPWWGVYSSNHVELAEPYDAPILACLPAAKENAREFLDCGGAYYDVGIGPEGMITSLCPEPVIPGEGAHMFLGQKTNGAFAAANMLMRFYSTYDLDYARRVYHFLSEIAAFWEGFLRFEGGRYVVEGDYNGETGSGLTDVNNCHALGLVRMLFEGIEAVSIELGIDADRRAKWRHIVEHLSEFPTVVVDGKRLLIGAEDGANAVRVGPHRQSPRVELAGVVFPSGAVGLGDRLGLLETMREDIEGWPESAWIRDYNGFCLVFTAAARVGVDPDAILRRLRAEIAASGLPNLWIFQGGGGIENCSAVPSCINEMLMQSHEGIVRIFPDWPTDRPARFARLRAYGAFLISSEYDRGSVTRVLIESERGRSCTVQNPWPGSEVLVKRADEKKEVMTGQFIELSTEVGESIFLTRGCG